MNTYDVGDQVRCSVTFTNSSGDPVDPTTVLFKYKINRGSTVTLTYGIDAAVVKTDTGDYYVDVTITQEGTWSYRFEGSGNVTAAAEGSFLARDSAFY